MAKGLVFIEGLDDVYDDLMRIAEGADEACVKSLEGSLGAISKQMKINAMSVFTDGYTKGVMVNSISANVSVKDGSIFGSVGVYDMSNKTGSSARRIPEPIIAYWYEMGIQPHSTASGARAGDSPVGKQLGKKPKNQQGKLHPGSGPRPFLSRAFDMLQENITKDIITDLNDLADKGA